MKHVRVNDDASCGRFPHNHDASCGRPHNPAQAQQPASTIIISIVRLHTHSRLAAFSFTTLTSIAFHIPLKLFSIYSLGPMLVSQVIDNSSIHSITPLSLKPHRPARMPPHPKQQRVGLVRSHDTELKGLPHALSQRPRNGHLTHAPAAPPSSSSAMSPAPPAPCGA